MQGSMLELQQAELRGVCAMLAQSSFLHLEWWFSTYGLLPHGRSKMLFHRVHISDIILLVRYLHYDYKSRKLQL